MQSDIYLPTHTAPTFDDAILNYKDVYNLYNSASKSGFMKLQLNHSFQYDAYFTALQLYLIKVANKTIDRDTVMPPVEPYVPKIQHMYLSYEATTSVTFAAIQPGTLQYIHLYPFGHDVMDPGNVVSGSARLMPQFRHIDSGSDIHHVGEFYIGLKDVAPAQK